MFIPRQEHELGKTVLTDQVTTDGTAVLFAANQTVKNGVIVQALSTNVGNVYIGGPDVTTGTGFQLQPGQATSVATDNLARLAVIGTSGNKICYITSA